MKILALAAALGNLTDKTTLALIKYYDDFINSFFAKYFKNNSLKVLDNCFKKESFMEDFIF
jgi:hypothetical protein